LTIHALGRLPLYSLGLILTFNLGRDITLITLYPFVFGALAVWYLDRHQTRIAGMASAAVGTPSQRLRPATKGQLLFAKRLSSGGFVRRKSFSGKTRLGQKNLENFDATVDPTRQPKSNLSD
jgi:hypothetical protein